MPQTTVDYHSIKAYEGQLASGSYNIVRGTMMEMYAGAPVPYGRALVRESKETGTGSDPLGGSAGTTEIIIRSLVLPSKADQQFMGIAVINETHGMYEQSLITNEDRGFMKQQPIDFLTFGDIWVWAEGVVRPGEAVSFRHTAEDGKPAGRFFNIKDEQHDEIATAIWLTPQMNANGGLAVVNLGRF